MLQTHSLILSSDYSLCGVMHVLTESAWVSSFPPTSQKCQQVDLLLRIALRWECVCTWCPAIDWHLSTVHSCHAPSFPRIHRNPNQDKAVTDDEYVNIQLLFCKKCSKTCQLSKACLYKKKGTFGAERIQHNVHDFREAKNLLMLLFSFFILSYF